MCNQFLRKWKLQPRTNYYFQKINVSSHLSFPVSYYDLIIIVVDVTWLLAGCTAVRWRHFFNFFRGPSHTDSTTRAKYYLKTNNFRSIHRLLFLMASCSTSEETSSLMGWPLSRAKRNDKFTRRRQYHETTWQGL